MIPRTFPSDHPFHDTRAQVSFSGRRLRAHALTQALAPRFEQLVVDCDAVHKKEIELEDKIDDTEVVVFTLDGELNTFAQRTSVTLLTITGGKRTDKLYLHYFGGKALHIFIRPVLEKQLKSMSDWVQSLQKSEHPQLQALGAELPALIDKAEKAATAKAEAEAELREFREVGERKKFIDDVNAARKETYGVLAMMPHKHAGLPLNFADSFFRRERAKDKPTLETIDGTIEKLKKELAKQNELREDLLHAEQHAKTEVEEQAKSKVEAKVAAMEEEIERMQKEAAALKATLPTSHTHS